MLRSPSVAQPSYNSNTVNIKHVDDGDDDDDQPEVDASVLTEEQKHTVRNILNK